MSSQLKKMDGLLSSDRSLPWTPLSELIGFDPFHNIRASYGFDYDVTRTEGGYQVEVPVPGYNSSHVSVSFKEGVIHVSAKSERRSFTRSFTVPDDVNPEAIQAKVQDGMLIITLQRHPEAQPRKIEVT